VKTKAHSKNHHLHPVKHLSTWGLLFIAEPTRPRAWLCGSRPLLRPSQRDSVLGKESSPAPTLARSSRTSPNGKSNDGSAVVSSDCFSAPPCYPRRSRCFALQASGMRVGFFSVGIGARPRRTLAGLRETEEKGLRPSQNCGCDSVKRILALVSLPEMPRLAGDAKWELSRQSLSFRERSSV
jgi:hypothetical protein